MSQHSITVAAGPEAVWEALKSADFARSWMLRALLAARGIGRQHLDLSSFIDREFVVLEESAPSTIVLGMVGRPHRSAIDRVSVDQFRSDTQPGDLFESGGSSRSKVAANNRSFAPRRAFRRQIMRAFGRSGAIGDSSSRSPVSPGLPC